jgi:hypothetical protein
MFRSNILKEHTDADYQSTGQKGAQEDPKEEQGACPGLLSAAPWSMYACIYYNPEEA